MILHTRIPSLFGAAAIAIYPVVLVLPERAGDTALLAHERVHQREQLISQSVYSGIVLILLQLLQASSPWWLLLFAVPVWWVAYAVPAFRLRAEVRAYRVQIAYGASLEGCARNLATHYWLRLPMDEARRLLS